MNEYKMQQNQLNKQLENRKARPVLVLTGPTASGKTAVAVRICQELQGEIVSADSMQIYLNMDIGTAKATAAEQKLVPHHMIDICEPGTSFSVAAYLERAEKAIAEIQKKGKLAVVCGGTGQYLSALMEGLQFSDVPVDFELRAQLEKRAEAEGLSALWNALCQIDPDAAQKIAETDQKRIVRAMELYIQTGMVKSEHNRRSREKGPRFRFIGFCLNHERSILYQRINQRVDQMIEQGLAAEVKTLIDRGIADDSNCMQAIGYKEMLDYLRGNQTLEDAASAIKQSSRRYAKRQLTWFRRMENLTWLNDLAADEAAHIIIEKIQSECI
jgi:tRNA dimethylallyltransferase